MKSLFPQNKAFQTEKIIDFTCLQEDHGGWKEDTFPIKEHENLTTQSYHEITKGINGEQFIRDFEGDKLDSLQKLPRIEKLGEGKNIVAATIYNQC